MKTTPQHPASGRNSSNDFTQGRILNRILGMAVPITLGQLINILYSVVDRIYVSRIPGAQSLALTGLGLSVPVTVAVMAFANLFGMGGGPLCSIKRGEGDDAEAQAIMCNSFVCLLITGLILTLLTAAFKKPLLYAIGASDQTYPYANAYLSIYMLGIILVMVEYGMNYFINAQGFGRISMITVMSGAIANIILDPIMIFGLNMGIQGAALATVISQGISAIWVLRFLTGKKAIYKLSLPAMKLKISRVLRIMELGFSGFIMAFTNSAVSVVCNSTLQTYGGDLYVGVMTVISTTREIIQLPVGGLTAGAQPVMGYNYGAKAYSRVRESIRVTSFIGLIYTGGAWILVSLLAEPIFRIFTTNPDLIRAGIPCLKIYYAAFIFMSLQFSGQSTFQALGRAKFSIFFSLLRKAIIVIPLTIFLPRIPLLGIYGVFAAEPISNILGGTACYTTMFLTLYRRLPRKDLNE